MKKSSSANGVIICLIMCWEGNRWERAKWLRKVGEKTSLKYNKSAGIKLAEPEVEEIDAALAFVWFMMAINSYFASGMWSAAPNTSAIVDGVSEFKRYNAEPLKDCSSPSQCVLHIDLTDIKAQLVKAGLRRPKTNLVWQICFKNLSRDIRSAPKQMVDSRVFCFFCFSL